MKSIQEEIHSSSTDQTNAAVTARMAVAASEASHAITTVKVGDTTLFSVPAGRTLQALTEHLAYPPRTKGIFPVNDADSFQKLVRRFDYGTNIVQLSLSKLSVICVCNYDDADSPGWRDHMVAWQLAKHRDLAAWEAMVKKGKLTQLELLMFLEDRIVDITSKEDGDPTQSQIETVIGNLEITTDAKFHASRDTHNDNFVLRNDSTGTPSIEVPRKFYIGVPIFEGLDHAYRIGVRLRYSVKEGSLTFTLGFENIEAVMDSAWEDVTKAITDALPASVPFINVP